jgi:hypothetical protein
MILKLMTYFVGLAPKFPVFPSFQLACKLVSDLYYFGCHEWSGSYPVIYSKLHIQVSLTHNTFQAYPTRKSSMIVSKPVPCVHPPLISDFQDKLIGYFEKSKPNAVQS